MTTQDLCPRCNEPVIRIEDQGKLGALYVHEDTTVTVGKGKKATVMPVKVACMLKRAEIENGANWTTTPKK